MPKKKARKANCINPISLTSKKVIYFFNKGFSFPQIANRYEVSLSSVYRVLNKDDYKASLEIKNKKIINDYIELSKNPFNYGKKETKYKSVTDLCYSYNIPTQTLYSLLKKNNVPRIREIRKQEIS
jgi:DNA invertase Pin-like site-specific DNA recombinase